ncbi:hypothetical protein B0H94_10237 [Salsuginibacillus halophilus]|uniref:Purine nucleoside phosphorylase n=1 Tax=Salsuginibacillus halophilus TaxID=517424 RepID=A0A2P8HWZ5_9BACI|nr:peptidoglycan editing factor PgeF [Salsuginibacillus halophilus]PSL50761.1 hypothetical protein B0H94_10237 [Salsuginibacillus halophilus]
MEDKEVFRPQVSGRWLEQRQWDNDVFAGISVRTGGVSSGAYTSLNTGLHVGDAPESVVLNRERLARDANLPLKAWVMAEQVHGAEVAWVRAEDAGRGTQTLETAVPGVDGLLTKETDIGLAGCFADCGPLYFYAPDQGIIGLAHAGWRGAAQLITSRMIEAMVSAGAELENLKAAIGPAIGAARYEVDDRVAQAFQTVLDDHQLQQALTDNEKGRYQLDMKEMNRQLLLSAGLRPENITKSMYCTAEEEALFFSHRRDGGPTGRMSALIYREGQAQEEKS